MPNSEGPRSVRDNGQPGTGWPSSVPRVALVVLGTVVIGYGLVGLLTDERGPDPTRYAVFFIAAIVGHDFVLTPLAIMVGIAITKFCPPNLLGLLRGGLIASAGVILVAAPFLLGYGYRPDVPSALPLDYHTGLLTVLIGIWAGILCTAAFRRLRPAIMRRSGGESD